MRAGFTWSFILWLACPTEYSNWVAWWLPSKFAHSSKKCERIFFLSDVHLMTSNLWFIYLCGPLYIMYSAVLSPYFSSQLCPYFSSQLCQMPEKLIHTELGLAFQYIFTTSSLLFNFNSFEHNFDYFMPFSKIITITEFFSFLKSRR